MPVGQRSPLHIRIVCSLLAIAVPFGVAGVIFSLVVKGPGTVSAWLIWGGAMCSLGWIFVGIPVIAAGDRVFRVPQAILATGVGICGALVMALPFLIGIATNDFGATGRIEFAVSRRLLAFEGTAFGIAASSVLLYRVLLARSAWDTFE